MPKEIIFLGKRYTWLIGSGPEDMYMEVNDVDTGAVVLGITQDDETGLRTLTTVDNPVAVDVIKQALSIFDSEVQWPIPRIQD